MSDKTQSEEWKVVSGWERYAVSNHGRIRNLSTGKVLSPGVRSGYHYITLCGPDGRRHTSAAVHRIVAAHFCPNPEGLPEVNHKDGIKLHNWSENLEWVTRPENLCHSYDIGLRKNGENSHLCTKLDEHKVRAIRRLYEIGQESQQSIAKVFGISQTMVGKVINKRKWRHVK